MQNIQPLNITDTVNVHVFFDLKKFLCSRKLEILGITSTYLDFSDFAYISKVSSLDGYLVHNKVFSRFPFLHDSMLINGVFSI